jgi:hypothetical protein
MSPHDDMLTPAETAEYLGGPGRPIPLATLTRWRYADEGPRYFKIGRAVRYCRSDLDRWLAAQAVEPQVAAR